MQDALSDQGAMEQVLRQRLDRMMKIEKAFMAELDIVPPRQQEPGDTLIDQDDAPSLSVDDE
jgi:hypothetical protein